MSHTTGNEDWLNPGTATMPRPHILILTHVCKLPRQDERNALFVSHTSAPHTYISGLTGKSSRDSVQEKTRRTRKTSRSSSQIHNSPFPTFSKCVVIWPSELIVVIRFVPAQYCILRYRTTNNGSQTLQVTYSKLLISLYLSIQSTSTYVSVSSLLPQTRFFFL